MRLVTALLAALVVAVAVAAVADDPVFVRWLDDSQPLDATILHYWERGEADELTAVEWVDLGTMLFERGFPNDAVEALREATDADPELTDAWFRIGLIYHKRGEVNRARRAYSKCLDIRPGHGWCNFYKGLLEERDGNPEVAVEHYETAFRHAPELADPQLNHEMHYSKLALAARIEHYRDHRFELLAPMAYLEAGKIRQLQRELAPTEPAAVAAGAPGRGDAAEAPPGAPGHGGSARTLPDTTSGAGAEGAEASSDSPWGVRGRATGRVGQPGTSPPPRPTPKSRDADPGGAPFHVRDVSPEARLSPLFGVPSWGSA